MTNDTKFLGTMSNVSKFNQTIDNGDVKNRFDYWFGQTLDELPLTIQTYTNNPYQPINNDIKYG